jgi:hypothetical protein
MSVRFAAHEFGYQPAPGEFCIVRSNPKGVDSEDPIEVSDNEEPEGPSPAAVAAAAAEVAAMPPPRPRRLVTMRPIWYGERNPRNQAERKHELLRLIVDLACELRDLYPANGEVSNWRRGLGVLYNKVRTLNRQRQ